EHEAAAAMSSAAEPHLLRATDLIGLPVVSIASGEDVAEVRDVVYDARKHQLVGFTLNKRGLFAGRMSEVLGTRSLAAIGGQAVMIKDESVLADSSHDPDDLRNPDDAAPVIGNRVLSADGNNLGTVSGVILTTGSRPEAVGYEVTSDERPAPEFV